jgi:hypothetical protein
MLYYRVKTLVSGKQHVVVCRRTYIVRYHRYHEEKNVREIGLTQSLALEGTPGIDWPLATLLPTAFDYNGPCIAPSLGFVSSQLVNKI